MSVVDQITWECILSVRLLWTGLIRFMGWIAQRVEDHCSQISLGNGIGRNSFQSDLHGSLVMRCSDISKLNLSFDLKLILELTLVKDYLWFYLTLFWNMSSNKGSFGRNLRLSGSCMRRTRFCTSIGLKSRHSGALVFRTGVNAWPHSN